MSCSTQGNLIKGIYKTNRYGKYCLIGSAVESWSKIQKQLKSKLLKDLSPDKIITIFSNFILTATVCKNQAKLKLLCTDCLKFSSVWGIMLLLLEKHHFAKKKFFWPPVPEIWLPKITQKFETMTIFWISRENILWCPIDHMCLYWLLCSTWGSVMKK